jgi:hypothetical protein
MDPLTNIPFLPKNKLGHLFIFWMTEVMLVLATYQVFRWSGRGLDVTTMEVTVTNVVRFVLSDDMLFFVILYILNQFIVQNLTQSIPEIVGKGVAATRTIARLNAWAIRRKILSYDDASKSYRQGSRYEKFIEGSSKKKVARHKQDKRDIQKLAVLLLAVTVVLIAKPFGWLKWLMIISILNGVLCLVGVFYLEIEEHKDRILYKRLKRFPPPPMPDPPALPAT